LTRFIPIAVIFIIIICIKAFGSGDGNFLDSLVSGVGDGGESYTQNASGNGGATQNGSASFTGGTASNTTDASAYKAHPADTDVSPDARAKYTALKGGGRDTATVLLYLCGTDLESEGGMATADLNEIAYAQDLDKINMLVYTGGAKTWQNSVISNKTNQVYRITPQGFVVLEPDLGRQSMADPDTLASFIRYGAENYPADRTILILWDHGGGSITGYCHDEFDPDNTMTIDEIGAALKAGGTQFDFVGFDACLMATLETALVLEPYADYMVASEATEPGTGWYYTNWLSMLTENTSTPTTTLATQIIDDFISDSARKAAGSQATLSLTDLAELKGTVPASFTAFAASTKQLLDSDDYTRVADARSAARDFSSSSRINQIDLIHFARNLGTTEATAFADTLASCVKYNRVCTSMTNANGLSIYFPYQSLGGVDSALTTYERIGMDDAYEDCVRSFASLAAGGQIVANGTGANTNLFSMLTGSQNAGYSGITGFGSSLTGGVVSGLLSSFLSDPSATTYASGGYGSGGGFSSQDIAGWFDADRAMAAADSLAANSLTEADFTYEVRDGQNLLVLSEEKWALVKSVGISVYADDGSGYMDLGVDNALTWTDEGDLVLDYSGDWIAIDGQPVSFYIMSEETEGDAYCFTGIVPVLLNGEPKDLIVVFDNLHPNGLVTGAQSLYTGGASDMAAKVDVELAPGDVIDFLCDYYTYDGDYEDSYRFGRQVTVPEGGAAALEIYNVSTEDTKMLTMHRLTDIYGNELWTKAVE
jgi:hypothetical protein